MSSTGTNGDTIFGFEGPKLKVVFAGTTDAGGETKQNQDEYFYKLLEVEGDRGTAMDMSKQSVNSMLPGESVVFCVLDGHGRKNGQVAARSAKASIIDSFSKKGIIEDLKTNPKEVLNGIFKEAHERVRQDFQRMYSEQGYNVTNVINTVDKTGGGFLLKQKDGTAPTTISGGTTCTVVVLLEGRTLLTANVGDSTALMGGSSLGYDRFEDIFNPCPTEGPPCCQNPSESRAVLDRPPKLKEGEPLCISADHSPECDMEFRRIARVRPSTTREHYPELLFVYDSIRSWTKSECRDIFKVDEAGFCRVTSRGEYHKNVRAEFASLVTTPDSAEHMDGLAFTRSIGDFHLQAYGITWQPDITRIDLNGQIQKPTSLVIASDGVWDNWKFEDVSAHFAAPDKVKSGAENIQGLTDEFMKENLRRALANFGDQCDNMTAIVCNFIPEE